MKHSFTKSLMCTLLLLIGTCANVWAWNVTYSGSGNVHILYDNSQTNWDGTQNVYFVYGNGGGTYGSAYMKNVMTAVSNTKLYQWDGTWNWGGVYIGFFTGKWGTAQDNNGYDNITNNAGYGKYTSMYNSTYNMNGGGIYLVTTSGSSNNYTCSVNFKSNADALNSTQTVKMQMSTDDGANWVDADLCPLGGRIDGKKFEFDDNITCNTATDAVFGYTSTEVSKSALAGYTSTFTITLGADALPAGYTYMGIYDSEGNRLTDGKSYNYVVKGETTTYIRFKKAASSNYYIAGNGTESGDSKWCNGQNWSPNNNESKLTDNGNGTYSITYNNLKAFNNYQFKITDGQWNTSTETGHEWGWGDVSDGDCKNHAFNASGNVKLELITASNVTITFTSSTKKICVSIVPVVASYAVTLAKNQDGWGTIAPTSIADVASGTAISADGATLTIGSTSVVATAAEQTEQYTYGLANPVWTWSPSGSTITAATTATANFTRTARTYNITYKDQGGGDYSGSNGSSLTANYTFDTGVAKLVAGVKAGYTFGGWFDNSACTGAAVTSIANDATGDKTLYAKWEAVADAWSMWYWSDRAIKIGDFTDNRDGTYSLTMTLTNTNALTLWFQNNSQHYIAPSSSLTTEQNLSTTGDGRFEWHTDPREKEYTLTIRKENGTWKVKAEAAAAASEWYLCGSAFGGYDVVKTYPYDKSYRDIANFYYRDVNLSSGDNYFQVNNGTTRYGTSNGQDQNLGNGYSNANTMGTNTAKGAKFNLNGTYRFCIDATTATNPKVWYESIKTYYNVTVTGAEAHGTYTLKDQTLNVACAKYSTSDTYVLTVMAATGYVPSLQVNGAAQSWTNVAGQVYTYSAQPTAATTLAVSYPSLYTVNFGKVGEGTVAVSPEMTSGQTVAGGTNLTFTATEGLNYKFDGWYGNSTCTGDKVSTEKTYPVTVNANTNVYAKFVQRTYAIVHNMTGGWTNPDMALSAGKWTYTKSDVAAGTYTFAISTDNTAIDANKLPNANVTYSGTKSGEKEFQFTVSETSQVTITYTPTDNTHGSLVVEVSTACTPNHYELWQYVNSTDTKLGDFEAGKITFRLTNDNRNNLYIKDNCGNTYGGTSIEPGQTKSLTQGSGKIQFNTATANKDWQFTLTTSPSMQLTAGNNPVAECDFDFKILRGVIEVSSAFVNDPLTFSATNPTGFTCDPIGYAYYISTDGVNYDQIIGSAQYVPSAAGTVYFKAIGRCSEQSKTKIIALPISDANGITLYFKSTQGVLINTGTTYRAGEEVGQLDGVVVGEQADCDKESWYVYSISNIDEIRNLTISTKSSSTTDPFRLVGKGSYFFDCTASTVAQVSDEDYCKTSDVTVYVYSPTCVPGLVAQYQLAGGRYQLINSGNVTPMTSKGSAPNCAGWYYTTFSYPNLANVQVELRMKDTSSDEWYGNHKISGSWTTIPAGKDLYWDASDLCGADNSNKPVSTDERPCQDAIAYSVTYDVNGGTLPAPVQPATVAGRKFALASGAGTRTGYTFGGWNDGSNTYAGGAQYTMPAHDVTLTAVWNKAASSSGWYMVGTRITSGNWELTEKSFAFDQNYRGMDNVFYKVVDSYKLGDYFKLHNTKNRYSFGSQESGNFDKTLADASKSNKMQMVVSDKAEGALEITDVAGENEKDVWVVFDVNSKKFWIEDIPTLFEVSYEISGEDHSATAPTITTTGGVAATQFAAGEKFVLTVKPDDGYTATIYMGSLSGEDVTPVPNVVQVPGNPTRNEVTYTYTGKIVDANQKFVIKYTKQTPMKMYVYMTNSVWSTTNGELPKVQWNKTNTSDWSGFNDNWRLVKLNGFDNWFEFTFNQTEGQCPGHSTIDAAVLTWQLKNGHPSANDVALNYSAQQQITIYDEAFCYEIQTSTNGAGERAVRAKDCPDMGLTLDVHGATLVGSTATIEGNATHINVDWKTATAGTLTLTYAYSYKVGDGEWVELETVDDKASLSIKTPGTYTYRVEAILKNDGVEIARDEATTTQTVKAPTLELQLSNDHVSKGATVNATPVIDNIASTGSMICFSVLKGNVDQGISFSETGTAGVYSFEAPSTNGTYIVRATLKIGVDCATATTVTYDEKELVVGDKSATLTVTPNASPLIPGGTVTLTVTPSGFTPNSWSYSGKTTANPVITSIAGSGASTTYTIPYEDTYTFYAVVSDGTTTMTLTSDPIVVSAAPMYILYPFGLGSGGGSWSTAQMTSLGDGEFTYYSNSAAPQSKYSGYALGSQVKDAAFIGTTSSNDATGKQLAIGITNPTLTESNNGDLVTFYLAKDNSLWILGGGSADFYRIKSETSYGVFYSNILPMPTSAPSDVNVSYFATVAGTQTLQKREGTSWVDLSGSIDKPQVDGIQVGVFGTDGNVTSVKKANEMEHPLSIYYLGGHVREYNSTNTMTDFSASSTTYYDHYFMCWCETNETKQVGGTVGNEINHNLANTLAAYTLPYNANVRFEYDSKTNRLSRTAITSGGEAIQLYGEGLSDGSGTEYTESATLKFSDAGDWTYQGSATATKAMGSISAINAYIVAPYNNNNRYLLAKTGEKTAADAYTPLIGATSSQGTYSLLLSFDYKTNRLTAGWYPTGTIDESITVDADIIFFRKENNDAQQVTMGDENVEVGSLKRVLFCLEIDGTDHESGESNYLITLPFDCKISDIYGISGDYMDAWAIQRYAGDERAKEGWFLERSTFWKWMDYSETLKAGEGYAFIVDRARLGAWYNGVEPITGTKNKKMKFVYFPSQVSGFTMNMTEEDMTIEYPQERCEILSPEDRRAYDSNWKLIGPMSYNNIKINNATNTATSDYAWSENGGGGLPKFIYKTNQNATTGYIESYTAQGTSEFLFHSFFSYMVQFEGKINWMQYTQTEAAMALSAPRRVSAQASASRKPTSIRLELQDADEEMADQTYVALAAAATDGFDQNLDLTKIAENRNTIWTVSADTKFAGNTLPIETDTVAVSVKIKTAGDYAIAMPEICKEYNPVLYDTYTNSYTSLNSESYMVYLTPGTYENRFYLLFTYRGSPSITTDVSNGSSEGAIVTDKVLLNGMLYLFREGHIYDAMGRQIK